MIVRIANQHRYVLRSAFEARTLEEQRAAVQRINDSLRVQGLAIDRLLGISDGTTQLRDEGYAREFVESLQQAVQLK